MYSEKKRMLLKIKMSNEHQKTKNQKPKVLKVENKLIHTENLNVWKQNLNQTGLFSVLIRWLQVWCRQSTYRWRSWAGISPYNLLRCRFQLTTLSHPPRPRWGSASRLQDSTYRHRTSASPWWHHDMGGRKLQFVFAFLNWVNGSSFVISTSLELKL